MQLAINFFCQRLADTFDQRQIVNARRRNAFDAAELGEQFLSAFCANPGDVLKPRLDSGLGAAAAMAGDGEAMRFVAYLLNQMQCRMIVA